MLASENFELREGPREVIIPEIKYLSCSGCKYLEHRMAKSGHDPIYVDNCIHPESEKSGTFFRGNLNRGIIINGIDTPEWCPFLKNKTEKNEEGK